ncbi:MAG: hypothetical protein ACYC1C_08160, partial [Chloroflexota bacterium]
MMVGMEQRREIERALRRTRRYWYEDGLTEMFTGAIFVLVGLSFVFEAYRLLGPFSPGFSALALPVLVVGGGLAGRSLVRRIKERFIYPRTGYVAYRRPPGQRSRLATGLVGTAMALLAGV